MREVRFGTPEKSLALARRMLEDRVDMHSSAWEEAAFELFAISEELGESDSALEFVEKTFPGFSDYAQPVSPELTILRIFALSAFFQLESPEQVQQRLDQLDYVLNELFVNGGGPVLRAQVLALRGDTQAAIDVALTEIFTKPAISLVGNLDREFELGFMVDVAADPRIRKALEACGEGQAQVAEEVRNYLANVEPM